MLRKKSPKISFHCSEDLLGVIPHPVPAFKAVPEWFRKINPVVEGSEIHAAGTIKRCVPVLDAVSQGYIIPLWCDMAVKVASAYRCFDVDGNIVGVFPEFKPETLIGKKLNENFGPVSSFAPTGKLAISIAFPSVVEGGSLEDHGWAQVGEQCDLKKFKLGKTLLKLINPWSIKTPSGWSVQIKNPANSWQHDITLLEGVVDTDEYYLPVNFPFVWTGGEAGEYFIPKGTPIAQVIPFKRETCELEVGSRSEDCLSAQKKKMSTLLFDRYKTAFWHKRDSKKATRGSILLRSK